MLIDKELAGVFLTGSLFVSDYLYFINSFANIEGGNNSLIQLHNFFILSTYVIIINCIEDT